MSKAKIKFREREQFKEGTVDFKDEKLEVEGKQYSVESLSLDSPLTGTVYGTLLNYQGAYDALEPSMHQEPYKQPPKAPVLYIKPRNTLIGTEAKIPMPPNVSELEMGAALGVVIGEKATNVKEEEALDYVSGYTIVNDVSIPHTSVYRPAVKEKARDGFCPAGPWIVTRDFINNPDELGIRVFINGELKQENNTRNLIRSAGKLIADVTSFMTLFPGDTLLVGVPENAPLANVNDSIDIQIDGIGTLRNTIVKDD
ncbi:fumarylacetoacetate hydrolase family protein [Virgibacillus kekensis]|uniref:Fumarylacetoacetate hydrolase family protein n=1 Tax=Virgibacillus kekensis TaxID=202261 RepID=A0ABV9DGH9_9BACI